MEAFYAVTLMVLVAAVAIATLTVLRRTGLRYTGFFASSRPRDFGRRIREQQAAGAENLNVQLGKMPVPVVRATAWCVALMREAGRVVAKALFTPAIHVTVLYRISAALYRFPLTLPLAFGLRTFAIIWAGTEIHPSVKIGPGLCIVHSQKVVIGPGVVIGSNLRIHHGCTIGPRMNHAAKVTTAITSTMGVNIPLITSASRAIGALDPCASCTSLTIC